MKPGSEWVGKREGEIYPIVYQGAHETDARTLIQAGLKAFCISYYNAWDAKNPKVLTAHPAYAEADCRCFLDSGAFSFLVLGYQRGLPRKEIERLAEAYLKEYAGWVKGHRKKLDFYITFDYAVEAPLVYRVTKELRKLGIRSTPVYHGDAGIDWLKRYADEGHKLICLSKRFFLNDRAGLRKFYDQVFNYGEKVGLSYHGLACTGKEAWTYPWYSIDSTSLVRMAGMGTILLLDGKKQLKQISIGDKFINGSVDPEVVRVAESRGISLEELQNERTKRVLFNALSTREFQESKSEVQWKRKSLF